MTYINVEIVTYIFVIYLHFVGAGLLWAFILGLIFLAFKR